MSFGPDLDYGLSTSQVGAPPGGGAVRILVAGMQASSTYRMRAALRLADGSTIYDSDHLFTTSAYSPDVMPSISVTHFDRAAESPGVQMLDCLNQSKLSLSAFDRDSNLIWAYQNADDVETYYFPAKMLENGNFLVAAWHVGVREIDLSGATVHEVTQAQVQRAMEAAGYQYGTITLHHDVQKLPNGHYLLLAQIEKAVLLNGNASPQTIIGDILIDADADANVKWVWNSFDHLDLNRHPFSTTDWTHSNAVVLTADGNLLLSMRQQSWILKIDYHNGTGTGDVLWRLGHEGDFSLQSSTPIDWFYMQHYPNILSENRAC